MLHRLYLPPKFDLSWPLIAIDPVSLGHAKMETRPTRILIKSVTLALYPPKLSSLDCSYFLMDPTCILFHISVFSHLDNQRKLTFGFVGRFRLRGIAAHVRYELHQRRSECTGPHAPLSTAQHSIRCITSAQRQAHRRRHRRCQSVHVC